MSNKIDAKDVEIFLLDNLDFFESRESLVGELKFKHSSSSASSLLERQIIKLRDEQKDLMDLLSSFVKEASVNEDLFNKSKDLTLSILGASSREDIIERVQDNFHKSFNVDKCLLSLHDNSEINDLEQKTGMSFHKGAIHCGSYSTEKMELLFEDSKVQSMVVAVIVIGKNIGLLMLGSYNRTKYLGDEDTTFIEYIRDILEKRFASESMNA
ncbi:DUF484 family protein [Gammaproteobacteria bacterium]|nr:DUF484 family protein [Gammaproteobacteria bacterium]MDB9984340.1 DUF484 family protein [Gammaproteobacteria bacterium]